MTEKKKKNTDIKSLISHGNTEKASQKHINTVRALYPDTPEQFCDTVRQAVEAQFPQQEYVPRTEPSPRKAQSPHAKGSGAKRRWYRYLLPAAAIIVIGSAALAAGSGWLREQLMERGLSREEADALVATEPRQQTTEMDVSDFPAGTVKEKDWDAPLLTVSEAYFDGTALYFLAQPSQEALSYDLYLKDHASINGHDSLTSLQMLEGEDKYLGQIELWDKQYTDEILEADSVSVTMRVVAMPKYEGHLLYTWKDSEAYEKIFETGAFQDEEGTQYYIVSAKESYTGYTPHKLTVEMPLTGGAKEIIEQYLEKGGLKEMRLAASEETLTESAGADAALDDASPDSGIDSDDTSGENSHTAKADPRIAVTGDHALCELPGASGSLFIDAQLVRAAGAVYTGTLETTEVSADILQSLYSEGDPGLWQRDGENSWKYGDQFIFVSIGSFDQFIGYQNDTLANLSPAGTDTEEEIRICENALESIGLESIVESDDYFSYDNTNYYVGQAVLEGLPIAYKSQWNSSISLCMENGQLAYLNAPSPLEVTEKEEAALMDTDEMLEHVAAYMASGDITPPESGQPVTEISLEYYVDLTKQGIVFRPVWNFKVPYISTEEEPLAGRENYFYIDAVTGALVRTIWGW